ncbi:MAG: hypothetical protein LC687_00470 [Actinobacteria bacterium]|nr:hypothetical protein [Actinomycetota bacterium]
MTFNWNLKVPYGYQSSYVTLRRVEEILTPHYQQASIRRHLAILHARGGNLGIGGTWRTCPHSVSQASMNCQSFHQDQEYADGFVGASAIDYVWRDGPDAGFAHDGVPTGGVPVQGSAEAKLFGIHANIGVPGKPGFESWHGQPIELDGWGTATQSGTRPVPTINPIYPLPEPHDPYPLLIPPLPPTGDEMHTIAPFRAYDSRAKDGPLKDNQERTVIIGMTAEAFVVVTAIGVPGTSPGYLSVNDLDGGTSIIGFSIEDRIETNGAPVLTPNGRIDVSCHDGSAHFAVDVYAVSP